MYDVVVIGAGISGAATAWELARAGVKVAILDRWGPAAMASGWTLAGVRQSGRHPAELPLARAAVAQWEGLAEELGAPTHYRREGNLRLARTPEEVPVIQALAEAQAALGLDITYLPDNAAIRAVCPAIGPSALAATYCASDGHADPYATVAAFIEAAKRHGAETRFGEQVLAIEESAGRVTAVRSDKGLLPCGAVVLCAGVLGNELLAPLGLGVPLDIHMVTVLRSVPVEKVLAPVIGVANADCAGRQEADGRFRATSGVEPWHGAMETSPRPAVHPRAETIGGVVSRFAAAVPAFADAPIESFWAGLIDLTPDTLPVMDRAPIEGLVIGMGFSGHGFCLGPVTGRILAALARGEAPDQPIEPFRLARFNGGAVRGEGVTLHG
ncbi:FAD-binding oxidoreductase [Acetobacteraceae bacterium H6797]|nr:FAD-binding oxidoreductase [Acetobacteraceae bacterium H6797]